MRLLLLFIFILTSLASLAQNDVLLTINDEIIKTDEFTRVYEKNISLINEEQNNSPQEYLKLFVNYKLKVHEAYRLGLDKKQSYISELHMYRSQLAKNHLNDVQVTEGLVQEAYDRTKNELKARHILIRVSPDALASDTLVAYNKLIEARERINAGENFERVAREVSQDPSAQKNGGNLGWFKAFKMVYPFETAAYSTPLKEVSMPFRTGFGYHIVQPIAQRPSKGSVKVAHIMISLDQQDTSSIAYDKIKEVEELLQGGAAFEILARNYSDDGSSSRKGGVLNTFEQGQLSSIVFEEKAFSLKEVGDIVGPFKTKFGWHIIKLLEKNPVLTFESMEAALTKVVTNDARARVISDQLNQKLRRHYQVGDNQSLITYFKKVFPEVYKRDATFRGEASILNKTALTIVDTSYTYASIKEYLVKRYKMRSYTSRDFFVENEIATFVDTSLKKYHLEHLEAQDPAFNVLLNDYKEGLLLYDLLEENIWKKAQKDTLGLKSYFDKNKIDYKTPKTYQTVVLTTLNKKIATAYRNQLKKGVTSDKAIEGLKRIYNTPIIVSSRDITNPNLIKKHRLSLGVSKVYLEGGNYMVYNVTTITEESYKVLEEVKGLVISDYQKELEQEFVKELRFKNKVIINEEVLNELLKKI